MMQFELTAALTVVAVMGLTFPSTRHLGLLSLAVLCVMYPLTVLALLVLTGGVFLFMNHRKRKRP